MRLLSSLALLTLSLSVCACSSESNQADGVHGAGGQPSIETYAPPTNGHPISESDACERLRSSFNEVGTSLGCVFTSAVCPGFVRSSGAPECSQYDEGSVQGCVDYYAAYSKCDDIRFKRCVVAAIQDSAPNGCEEQDAGAADSAADVGGDADSDAAGMDGGAGPNDSGADGEAGLIDSATDGESKD